MVAPLLFMTLVAVTVVRHAGRLSLTRQAGVGPAVEDGARSPLWRVALAGSVIAALVVAALAAAIPALPAISKTAASLNRAAPLANATVIDPVDAMAALRNSRPDSSAQPLLRVRTDESSSGYLAAAILDDYDGARWSFASTFRPTGGRIPPAAGSAGTATVIGAGVVRQDETLLTALPLPMLPALDRPVSIEGLAAEADSSTGMILPGQALKPGSSFEVTSRTPGPTMVAVPRANGIGVPAGQTVGSTGAAPDLAVPADSSAAMTTALRFLSNLTGERPAASVAFLQAALSALHTDERRVDPTLAPRTRPASPRAATRAGRTTPTTTAAPPSGVTTGGTSLSEVIDAVTFDQSATPEQFATFFAMVARDLGVPARVVTGFRLVTGSSAGPVAPGTYQVTNRMAWTWVEIPVAGGGWVVADPTPDTPTTESAPPPLSVRVTPTTLAPPQANAVPRSEIAGAHAIARPVHIDVPRSHHLPPWVLALLVGAAIVVAALLVGPGLAGLRRQVRRRRRHRADPSELAVGAWLESPRRPSPGRSPTAQGGDQRRSGRRRWSGFRPRRRRACPPGRRARRPGGVLGASPARTGGCRGRLAGAAPVATCRPAQPRPSPTHPGPAIRGSRTTRPVPSPAIVPGSAIVPSSAVVTARSDRNGRGHRDSPVSGEQA